MPTDEHIVIQVVNQQQQVSITTESYTMDDKLHLGIKLHLGAEFQIETKVYSDYEISVHERNIDVPNREVHSDFKVDRPIKERRA